MNLQEKIGGVVLKRLNELRRNGDESCDFELSVLDNTSCKIHSFLLYAVWEKFHTWHKKHIVENTLTFAGISGQELHLIVNLLYGEECSGSSTNEDLQRILTQLEINVLKEVHQQFVSTFQPQIVVEAQSLENYEDQINISNVNNNSLSAVSSLSNDTLTSSNLDGDTGLIMSVATKQDSYETQETLTQPAPKRSKLEQCCSKVQNNIKSMVPSKLQRNLNRKIPEKVFINPGSIDINIKEAINHTAKSPTCLQTYLTPVTSISASSSKIPLSSSKISATVEAEKRNISAQSVSPRVKSEQTTKSSTSNSIIMITDELRNIQSPNGKQILENPNISPLNEKQFTPPTDIGTSLCIPLKDNNCTINVPNSAVVTREHVSSVSISTIQSCSNNLNSRFKQIYNKCNRGSPIPIAPKGYNNKFLQQIQVPFIPVENKNVATQHSVPKKLTGVVQLSSNSVPYQTLVPIKYMQLQPNGSTVSLSNASINSNIQHRFSTPIQISAASFTNLPYSVSHGGSGMVLSPELPAPPKIVLTCIQNEKSNNRSDEFATMSNDSNIALKLSEDQEITVTSPVSQANLQISNVLTGVKKVKSSNDTDDANTMFKSWKVQQNSVFSGHIPSQASLLQIMNVPCSVSQDLSSKFPRTLTTTVIRDAKDKLASAKVQQKSVFSAPIHVAMNSTSQANLQISNVQMCPSPELSTNLVTIVTGNTNVKSRITGDNSVIIPNHLLKIPEVQKSRIRMILPQTVRKNKSSSSLDSAENRLYGYSINSEESSNATANTYKSLTSADSKSILPSAPKYIANYGKLVSKKRKSINDVFVDPNLVSVKQFADKTIVIKQLDFSPIDIKEEKEDAELQDLMTPCDKHSEMDKIKSKEVTYQRLFSDSLIFKKQDFSEVSCSSHKFKVSMVLSKDVNIVEKFLKEKDSSK